MDGLEEEEEEEDEGRLGVEENPAAAAVLGEVDLSGRFLDIQGHFVYLLSL